MNGIASVCTSLAITAISLVTPRVAQADDLVSALQSATEIKVAVASQPPFMSINPQGEAEGFALELENIVLREIGVPPMTPVLTAWNAMIPGLQGRQVDYVSVLAPTEERCKVVLFSAPVYMFRVALYVKDGNPKSLRSIEQLAQDPDIKIALIDGSAQATYAYKVGVQADQVVRVPDVQAGIASVVNGRADAYIETTTAVFQPEKRGVELVIDKDAPIGGASAAFRKEDVALRDAFNEKLNALVQTDIVLELYEKYGMSGGADQAELLRAHTKASDISASCQ